jgi:hypothetical protein
MRRTLLLPAALVLAACSSGDSGRFFNPQVVLRLSLPAELDPFRVQCLDLVISAPVGEPPPTSLAFGTNPFFIKVQTLDVDGDGRRETRIRFTEGSAPFIASVMEIRLNATQGADPNAVLVFSATGRAADGQSVEDDRCLGGTPLAQGTASQDARGQPIRFPASGQTTVDLPMACVLPGGCASPDAGARDAGVTDAGIPDAGVTDAGVPDAGVTDAGVTDAGVTDAGVTDAGVTDGGVADGGLPGDGGSLTDGGFDSDGGTPDGGFADGG